MGEQVFSLCYAEVSDNVYELSAGEGFVYGIDDVEADGEEYSFISHDVSISDTAQGGFIVDCDGAVLGLLTNKATAAPYGGLCAYSAIDIMDNYLYDLGWDDYIASGCPSDAVFNSFGNNLPEQSDSDWFERLLAGLSNVLRFELDVNNSGLYLGIASVLLLIGTIILVFIVCVGGLFLFLVLAAGAIVVVSVVRKKHKNAVKGSEEVAVVAQKTDDME